MGIGGAVVRGLGAAMQGYGKTLIQQDEREYKERESQAIMNRQLALEEVRNRQRMGEIAYTGRVNTQTYRENKATDVDAETVLLPIKTDQAIRANTATENARQVNDERTLKLQHANAVSLATLNSGLQRTETQLRIDQEAARDAAVRGVTVARWERTVDGQLNGFNAEGKAVFSSKAGAYEGADEPSEESGGIPRRGGTIPPKRLPRASDPAALPRPAATESFDRFENLLSQAAISPRNKGKPAAELRREVIELARTNGIAAPDR